MLQHVAQPTNAEKLFERHVFETKICVYRFVVLEVVVAELSTSRSTIGPTLVIMEGKARQPTRGK